MRASAVVKRQSTFMVSWLRWSCHVLVSLRSASWSGIRRDRHCRANTPQFDFRHVQPAAVLGSVVNFQPLSDAPGLGGFKRLIHDAGWWVFKLSITSTIRSRSG